MKLRLGFVAGVLGLALFGAATAQAIVSLPPRPFTPPGYACRWVPPLYRTLSDRVWVDARVDMVPQWFETSPGHMERLYRQVITPGHWESTARQVLIADGHWELVAITPPPPPVVVVPAPWPPRGGTVGVEGYDSRPGENPNPFSGLSEWPEHN